MAEKMPTNTKFCPFRNTPVVQVVPKSDALRIGGLSPSETEIKADLKTFQCMGETCSIWSQESLECGFLAISIALFAVLDEGIGINRDAYDKGGRRPKK